jgi:hypothetical protein
MSRDRSSAPRPRGASTPPDLTAVERDAASLPWARERRWTARTHVRIEGPWLLVDLHDLSVALAIRVLDALETADVPAFRLVTGSGRHTGGRSKLRDAVIREARSRGWSVTPLGPARLEVVRDARRSPTGGPIPWVVWVVLALVVVGLLAWWFG